MVEKVGAGVFKAGFISTAMWYTKGDGYPLNTPPHMGSIKIQRCVSVYQIERHFPIRVAFKIELRIDLIVLPSIVVDEDGAFG